VNGLVENVPADQPTEVCRRLRAATNRPIWLKTNAGLPQVVQGRAVYTASPEEFAGYVPELVKLGAAFIGSCCGSNPGFVAAIAHCVREIRSDT